ncbi:MAG: tyrosine-type recombinase/integrase [Candidatus Woesearchaeota archaeon]
MDGELKKITPFKLVITVENGYPRLNVSHPAFKGRIRKRTGNGNQQDHDTLISHLKVELEKYFINEEITKEAVNDFVNYYIDMYYTKKASIFDYFDEFLEVKQATFNKRTDKFLSKSAINTFIRTKDYFEKYLSTKRIKPYPANIDKAILDGYYHYLKKAPNYKVKLHQKFKEFVRYLVKIKGFPVHPSYEESVFLEKYDNQDPNNEDRALTNSQLKKLLELREQLYSGSFRIQEYKKCKTIANHLQLHQRETKYKNLILSLDCFLFMTSTGQYLSDIKKSILTIKTTKVKSKHISYRRAKNNSKCKGIPVADYCCFICKTLIEVYKISNGKNFPYTLTLNTLDKHLKEISKYCAFDFYITSKMGRKTFASRLYYDHNLDIKDIQVLLGHKSIKETYKYLRIEDDDIANSIFRQINEH